MRALNMQALTNDIQRQWPGTTVWGKGDVAHQSSSSDHNEDDTAGSKPEQTDADSNPEHRAIDVPVMGPMTMPILRDLRARLTDRPANRARMKYVILEQTIWRRNGGWVPERYTGEWHGHLHVSGYAPDDENPAGWDIWPAAPAVTKRRGKTMATLYFNKTTRSEWALAGDSPGTPANWLTTNEQGVANQWAAAHGSAVELYAESYEQFRQDYLSPVRVEQVEDVEP